MDLGMMKKKLCTVVRSMLITLSALTAAAFLSACNGNGSSNGASAEQGSTSRLSSAAAPEPPSATKLEGNSQPKLPVLKLWVGTNQIAAEIASTVDQIRTGMMFRTNMAEMEGMLFVFGQPQQVAFYMRNTLLPLSCAYIDAEGTILELYDMEPLNETPIPSQSSQVQYVLEMNQGWFKRHNIGPGMVISTERGTFAQTFWRR